jgi:Secretion system C-terminal sorting domain
MHRFFFVMSHFILGGMRILAMNVSVHLYNYLGEEVLTNNTGIQGTRQHLIKTETANLSPGIYILKFESGTTVTSQIIIILK